MSTSKKIVLAVAGALGAVLGAAALAWACTPPAFIMTTNVLGGDAQGVPGTVVRIDGGVAIVNDPTPLPIEMHWRSETGAEIRLLKTIPAQTPNGLFSTTVQIPADASPGVYLIVAMSAGREDLGTAPAAYQVIASRPDVGSGGGGPDPVTQSNASSSGADGVAGPAAGGNVPAAGGSADASPAMPGAGATAGGANPVAGGVAATQNGSAARANPATASAPGQPAASGAATPSAVAGARSDGAATPGAGRTASNGTPWSVDGDLWSGLNRTPSLAPSSLRAASSAAVPAATLAIGILSAGFVLLSAGFGLAEVRRRRVLVRS